MEITPPDNLSNDLKIIWNAWYHLGDREVVREAATKGHHINLAQQFLSFRKQLDISETKRWFEAEVKSWCLQLLMQKQVFRSCHILTNIGLDAPTQFLEIFLETKDPVLRQYLYEHLHSKSQKLDSNLLTHLKLFDYIQKHNSEELSKEEDSDSEVKSIKSFKDNSISCLKDLIDKDKKWKCQFATKIFFDNYDFDLISFLENQESFDYLISTKNIKLLNNWLHIYYSNKCVKVDILKNRLFQIETTNIKKTDKLYELFKNWEISSEDIFKINNTFLNDYLSSQLCVYDIIAPNQSVQELICLYTKARMLQQLNQFEIKTMQNNLNEFDKQIIEYCLNNGYFLMIVAIYKQSNFNNEFLLKLNNRELNFWLSLIADNTRIITSIVENIKFLNANIFEYIEQNPFVLFALLLITNQVDQILCSGDDHHQIKIDDYEFDNRFLKLVYDKFEIFKHVDSMMMMTSMNKQIDITLYQLISNHSIDVTKLFYNKFNNIDGYQNFSSEYLIKKYGHMETENYLNYLLNGRPCMAFKVFSKKFSKKKSKIDVKNLIYPLAINNYENSTVVSSIFVFYYLLCRRDEQTKPSMTTTITSWCCQNNMFRINLNILQILNDTNYIKLFLEPTSLENQLKILTNLENKLLEKYSDDDKISTILLDWDIAVSFCLENNLSLPIAILKTFLKRNDWLKFLIFVQYFNYNLDQVVELLSYLKDIKLREHLTQALSIQHDNKLKKTDYRKDLYRNIGVDMSNTSKKGSSLDSLEIIDNNLNQQFNSKMDFFETVILCTKNERGNTLIQAAKFFHDPFYVILATCYQDGTNKLDLWFDFVLCSGTKTISTQIEYICSDGNLLELEKMEQVIGLLIKHHMLCTLIDSFKIFFPDNPLCLLMVFLKKFLNRLNYNEYLIIFKAKLYNLKEEKQTIDTDLIIPINYTWICEMTFKILNQIASYYFNSKFEQMKFVTFVASEFNELNFNNYDYDEILKILNLICYTNVSFNLDVYLKDNRYLIDLIDQLKANNHLDLALQLCRLNGICDDVSDEVLLEKLFDDFKKVYCIDDDKNSKFLNDKLIDKNSNSNKENSLNDNDDKFNDDDDKNSKFLIDKNSNSNKENCLNDNNDKFNDEDDKNSKFLIDKNSNLNKEKRLNDKINKNNTKGANENDKNSNLSKENSSCNNNVVNDKLSDKNSNLRKDNSLCDKNDDIEANDKISEENSNFDNKSNAKIDNFDNNDKLFDDFDKKEKLWMNISNELTTIKNRDEKVINFLCRLINLVDGDYEINELLKITLNYFESLKAIEEFQNFEANIWLKYLRTNEKLVNFEKKSYSNIYFSELRHRAGVNQIKYRAEIFKGNEQIEFENLINHLLDRNQIILAMRLEHLFNYRTRNFKLIETCMKLAEGEIELNCIDYNLLQTNLIGDNQKLKILEMFVDCIEHGKNIAGRIYSCYLVSETILRDKSYVRTLKDETLNVTKLIKSVLYSDHLNKLELAAKIMTYHDWSRSQIIHFVCDEIVSAINKYVLIDTFCFNDIMLWGFYLHDNIHKILKLCPDAASDLGKALLIEIENNCLDKSKTSLYSMGEILIQAHECFTADCNMEGISIVLKKVKLLIMKIIDLHKQYDYVIDLLTKIKRFNEMEYVIDLLIEHNHFERFLSQSVGKNVQLCRAIVNYLIKHPQHNNLTHLVALKWQIHDTSVNLWLNDANKLIKNLVSVAKLEMKNNDKPPGPFKIIELNLTDEGTKKILETAISYLTHAIEYCLLAELNGLALKITKFAELIAMQLSLTTSSAPCVLELTEKDQVNYLICYHLNFHQARILFEYYDDFEIEWSAILYEKCVVNNDLKYLDCYLINFSLNETLVKDIVRRYFLSHKNNMNVLVPKLIFYLIDNLKSPVARYRLASELGLREYSQNILDSDVAPYFEDTVYKIGCRSIDF